MTNGTLTWDEIKERNRALVAAHEAVTIVTPPVTRHGVVTGSDDAPSLDAVLARIARDDGFSAAIRTALDAVAADDLASSNRVPLLGSAVESSSYGSMGDGSGSVDRILEVIPREGVLAHATLTVPDSTDAQAMRAEIAEGIDVTSAWLIVGTHNGQGHVHSHGLILAESASALRSCVSSWCDAHGGVRAAKATIVTGWPAWSTGRDAARSTLAANLGRVLAYDLGHTIETFVSFGALRVALGELAPSRGADIPTSRDAKCIRCGAIVTRSRHTYGYVTCSAKCSSAIRSKKLRDKKKSARLHTDESIELRDK